MSADANSIARRPQLALFGKFGAQNMGNECTLAALLDNIRQHRIEASVFCVSSEPIDTTVRHNIPAVRIEAVVHTRGANRSLARLLVIRLPKEILGWLKAIVALRGTRALLMTGTGMLTDSGESLLGFPYEILKWVCAARCSGCQVRFVAVGVGPMRRRLTRVFVHAALRLAHYRSYRDVSSRARLQEQGFNVDRDSVVPDLVFSLPQHRLSTQLASGRARPVVGVGIMDNYGPPDTAARQEAFFDAYIKKTAAFIAWLVRHKYAVHILHGDVLCDAEPRVRLRRELTRQGVGLCDAPIVDSDIASVDDLLRILSATDIIVSPRYHNLVLAMMLSKPVIGLSYDYKNEALLTEAGLGDYSQRIEELDVQKLIAQFERAERNASEIKRLLERVVGSYQQQWLNEYPKVLAGL